MAAELIPPTMPVEKVHDAKPETDALAETEMVHTAIGPLPTDLWHLLDQSPPRQGEPATATVSAFEELAAEETRLSSVGEELPGVMGVMGSALPEDGGPAERQSGVRSGEEWVDAAPESTGRRRAEMPDTDELARQVYAEIKRRLSVEWERIRARL
jgi:hypothetical protein